MQDPTLEGKQLNRPLSLHQHQLLVLWAADCAEHVLSVVWDAQQDPRPVSALQQARAWAHGHLGLGNTKNAVLAAHAAARESLDEANTAAARSAGHAVATVQRSDHGLVAARYALKATQLAELDAEQERQWQDAQLPGAIQDVVLNARSPL